MTQTTAYNGRLGNQIFRNLAVSLIAEKNDLNVHYANAALIESLGIKLFSGSQLHSTSLQLTDDNYFSVYESGVRANLDANASYFQTQAISNLLYNHLRSAQASILEKNPFQQRYQNNNDVHVHVRLTDVAHHNPGAQYYLEALASVGPYDTLYLSSDNLKHPIVEQIVAQHPATLLNYDEIKTFQFASTCRHQILSHGSFSAVIGYLSFFSEVHYPKYSSAKMWYGDMFSIPGWVQH